jgi:hypothetical protein
MIDYTCYGECPAIVTATRLAPYWVQTLRDFGPTTVASLALACTVIIPWRYRVSDRKRRARSVALYVVVLLENFIRSVGTEWPMYRLQISKGRNNFPIRSELQNFEHIRDLHELSIKSQQYVFYPSLTAARIKTVVDYSGVPKDQEYAFKMMAAAAITARYAYHTVLFLSIIHNLPKSQILSDDDIKKIDEILDAIKVSLPPEDTFISDIQEKARIAYLKTQAEAKATYQPWSELWRKYTSRN